MTFRNLTRLGVIVLAWTACFTASNLFGQITITNTSPLPDGVVGTAYSQTMTSTGGGGGQRTWTVVQGALPAGLTLATNGNLTGTPTVAGTSNFRIRVTAQSQVGEKDFTLQISAPISISTSALPGGTQGLPYSQALTATGGETPYTWAIVTGTLPAGLSLSGSNIVGTPTAAGTSNFTVRVTDSSTPAQTMQRALSIVVVALTITTPSPLPAAVVGIPYSQTLTATNGTAPYTWSITSGNLPAGLTLSGGTISGTPTSAGTSNFTVRVADSSSPSLNVQKNFVLQVLEPLTITTTSPLTSGLLGVAYSQSLTATGGTAPYTWSILSGALPAGLSLSGSTISGTPTVAALSNFTIRVTDSSSPALITDKAFALDVTLPLIITTASPLPSGVPGTPYSQTLSAAGGVAPYSWSVITGSLPAGLTLNGATISGTPTTPGTSNFTIRVLDSSNPPLNFQRSFALSIIGAVTVTTASPMPSGTIGTAYSQALTAAGGTTPYSWSITSGALPAGLTLNGATISGNPTTAGTFNFTVRVADGSLPQQTAQKALTIVVGAPISITTTSPLPNGAAGVPYSQNFTATGGASPYSWSVASGTLPAGLSLSSGGLLSGTATQTGSFNFSVSVSDSSSPARTATAAYQITLKPFLAITTAVLPAGAVGSSYSVQVEASGDPPLTWSMASGTLPPGVNLSSSGLLSGTPTSTGTFGFTLRVTSDSPSQEATRSLQIVVNAALTLTTTNVADATRFVPYSTTLGASGGVTPYSWSVISGNLPAGLNLSAGGVISGTPTAVGSSTFTVRVTDAGSATAQRAFTINVEQGMLLISTQSLPGGVQGFAYSHQFQAAGGPTPFSWALASGSLPSGFNLSSAGLLQGTSATPVTRTFSVRVTDAAGSSDVRQFTLVIGPPIGTISLNGLQLRVNPVQQIPISLSVASAPAADLQGTLTLSFASTAVVPVDDAAVQFSTGGRTVSFTIPANTTTAVFPSSLILVTGTVAGTISITGSITNGPSNQALASSTIESTAPQMTSVAANRITGGLRVRVIGYSPERRVTEVEYIFEVRVNGVIEAVTLTRPVTTEFNAWYQNPASAPFGSAFGLEQLFSVNGEISAIEAVRVTLRNAQGSTTSARTVFTNN